MNSNIISRFDKMVVVKQVDMNALDESGNERDRLCRLSVFFLYVSQLAGYSNERWSVLNDPSEPPNSAEDRPILDYL